MGIYSPPRCHPAGLLYQGCVVVLPIGTPEPWAAGPHFHTKDSLVSSQ